MQEQGREWPRKAGACAQPPGQAGIGDEIVPDLRLNQNLVDPGDTFPAKRRQTYSAKAPLGLWTPSSSRSIPRRSFSGPASPASMFLGHVNMQLSVPSEPTRAGAWDDAEQIGVYTLGRILGTGGFSVVREARRGDHVLAVKIIDKRQARAQDLDYEREIWESLRHPNILPLTDVQDTTNSLYLFTNCMESGSLHDFVRKTRGSTSRPVKQLRVYIKQLVQAVKYLHNEKRIVHRDIKLENCLLDSERGLQLCDFGLSQYIDELASDVASHIIGPSLTSSTVLSWQSAALRALGSQFGVQVPEGTLDGERERDRPDGDSHNTFPQPSPPVSQSSSMDRVASIAGIAPSLGIQRRVSMGQAELSRRNSVTSAETTRQAGSMHFAAPELLSDDGLITPAVDIWALGVVVYTAMTGRYPWHHSLPQKMRNLILTTNYDDAILDDDVKPIVSRCLVRDIENRARIDEIAELVESW